MRLAENKNISHETVLDPKMLSRKAEKFLFQNKNAADKYIQTAARALWRKLNGNLKQLLSWEDLLQIGRMAFIQKVHERNGSEFDIGLYVKTGIEAMHEYIRSQRRKKRGGGFIHTQLEDHVKGEKSNERRYNPEESLQQAEEERAVISITDEVRESLARSIDLLDITSRHVLKLRFNGKKQKEIAHEIGISQSAVSKAIRRGLKFIFDVLPGGPVDTESIIGEIKKLLETYQIEKREPITSRKIDHGKGAVVIEKAK